VKVPLRGKPLLLVVLFLACGQGPGAGTPPLMSAGAAQTWTWDEVGWNRISGAGPEQRFGAAMTFDTARGVTVLFGGYGTTGFLGDTWTWDGHRWAKKSPAHEPPARGGAAMAYDTANQVVLMFGGTGQDQHKYLERNDLWIWDGKDWTLATPAGPVPAIREGAVMFYDDALKRVVLFGGQQANERYYADLWAWDGHQWSLLPVTGGPQGRSDAALAYDAGRGELLVFGGQGFSRGAGKGEHGLELGDTWILGATGWKQVNSSPAPTKRYGAATTYDPLSDRVLIVGGFECPKRNDLWAWTGSAWQSIPNSGSAPPALGGAGLVNDPLRKVDVLFGGSVPECVSG
jgi:hypothetical protein